MSARRTGAAMSARIGVSPLTGRVFRGRVNKAGNAFVGEKQDITSDVLRAVVEKAEFHGGSFEIEGGAEKWTVTVTKQPDAVLLCQVDSLRDALLKVLDTREAEAKAWFSSNNAKDNFSDRGVKEERLHLAAMTAASNAEKEARLLLATLKASE